MRTSSNRRFASSAAGPMGSGLPTINPTEFAIKKKREEDANMRRIIQEARLQFCEEEMYPAHPSQIKKLHDGFTKEEKGKYQYLDERKRIIPEKKYSFPILSSWKYGWKLGEEKPSGRPNNARTKLITDTFYTRNGVPTLSVPTQPLSLDRGYTVF